MAMAKQQTELQKSLRTKMKVQEMSDFDVCVIGLGYIGLPTAAMFATHNLRVLGVDINPSIVDTVGEGKIHIVEPMLETAIKSAVQSQNLLVSTKPSPAKTFIIAVPTPFKSTTKEPDVKYVQAAITSLSDSLA